LSGFRNAFDRAGYYEKIRSDENVFLKLGFLGGNKMNRMDERRPMPVLGNMGAMGSMMKKAEG